jgi:mono/diheme cytochrome c family protein
MRFPLRDALLVLAVVAAVATRAAGPATLAARQQEHQTEAAHPPAAVHRHADAAKLKNPVTANATSIAAGQKLYVKQCAVCHGDTGKGDGKMGEEMIPKPADFTDDDWKHGSSDGEIFTLIRNGAKGTGMKAYSRKLTTHEIWDLVNYIRSIGPAKGD